MRALFQWIVTVLAWAGTAAAQPTTFTYQGRLNSGGQPASGLHDFRFKLFDAQTGGSQLGQTQCADNVSVSEGFFTIPLDFGQQFASPNERFLEIEVRANTGLNCGNAAGFVLLAPRQLLTAAPLASHAKSAFALDAQDGSPRDAVFVDNTGNVGIGTGAPDAKLHLTDVEDGVLVDGPGIGAANRSWLEFRDAAGTRTGYIGDGSGSDVSMYLASDAGDIHLYTAAGAALTAKDDAKVGVGTTTPASTLHVNGQSVWLTGGNGGGLPNSAGAGLRLYFDSQRGQIFAFDYATATPRHLALQDLPGANVGIGTSTPTAKLDVRGDIRLGSSGQFQAAAGTETLRLVRGDVDGNGTILLGTGFTCQRVGEGVYDIRFSPAFGGIPSVTVTAMQAPNVPRMGYSVPELRTSSFVRIHCDKENGVGTDSDFSFCVIGPR